MLWTRRLFQIPLLLAAFAVTAPTSSFAGTVAVWGGGNGNWFSSNWGVLGLPNGPGVTADIGDVFLRPLVGTVTLNGPMPVNLPDGVVLGTGAAGGLQVSGVGNLTAGTLLVGNIGPGTSTLAIQSGGVVNSIVTMVGNTMVSFSTAIGSVTVSDVGSTWNNSGGLYVGNSGTGSLNVLNGGVVSAVSPQIGYSAGSIGMVTVSGAGSTWNNSGALTLGNHGQGTLNIKGGAQVSDTYTNIGSQANSSGVATVSGVGSQWNNSSALVVGEAGSSILTITGGGLVSDARPNPTESAAVIGLDSGSSGTVQVSGTGSTWNNTGPVNVGYSGNGSLHINNGGQVTTAILLVGSQPGSSGTVTIQSGGHLTNTGSAFVGGVVGSAADVLVDAGSWANTGSLSIGIQGQGAVTVTDGGLLSASSIIVGRNGSLIVDPSTVSVTGNFTLSLGGLLSLDIAGSASGSVSQLDIAGFGSFDGIIDYDFIDGFAPRAGEAFDLINATGGVNLSAATIQIEGLEPGFTYSEIFANGEVKLTALNNGTSNAPEPNSGWLLAGTLSSALLGLASRKAFLRSRQNR